ncbi:MAG: TetR/AcrR family transcriptional regulator [Sphingomonas sanxanigenens]|uniref:TetR/AcrR family transcriptional regulator n=1 Tax=Sphingomonas sanxanigenens TaxID=397260 RepID=A0A2W5ACJ1_9SPHN|nr:MAG: TetR/AcrR family transcriptional regulator [Sphingomonas sanxanigenens]
MSDTEISSRGRGRPRAFDIEQATQKAQALFHEHGYDAVSVAALSEALGINPPSFYAAFGSKAGLFDRVLRRYAESALPLDDILAPGRPIARALGELLETAARIYAADPAAPGCLVLEAARAGPAGGCRNAALPYRSAARSKVRAFIAAGHPHIADTLADYVDVTMSGLSASARERWSVDRLVAVARTAALAIPPALAADA